MLYVGLDAHLKMSAICVLGSRGNKIEERIVKGHWPKVIEALKEVKEEHGQQLAVCFEASCGSGHLHDQVRKIARKVVVAHPGQLRLIFRSKKKNDRMDAENLAKLLFLGQVPPVYVPRPWVRSWRQMIECRNRFVNKRTRTKNEIRSHLRTYGIKAPYKLWNKEGMAWLHDMEMPDEMAALHLDLLLDELEGLIAKVKRIEHSLNRIAKDHPGVQLLMTIPGVGVRTAEALAAYIDDPHRFANNEAASYFGLVASEDTTGGRIRRGHITKQGPPTVRKLLVEAAWFSIRRSEKSRRRFDRIVCDSPERRKIAIVAVAHYLLRVSISMLKHGEAYDEAA